MKKNKREGRVKERERKRERERERIYYTQKTYMMCIVSVNYNLSSKL